MALWPRGFVVFLLSFCFLQPVELPAAQPGRDSVQPAGLLWLLNLINTFGYIHVWFQSVAPHVQRDAVVGKPLTGTRGAGAAADGGSGENWGSQKTKKKKITIV